MKIKMYSPSKHRFKRVISMNAISESPDTNLPSEENHALVDDDEYSDWNGFSSDAESANDASTNFPAHSEEQKRENPRFILETSPLESSQSFVDFQRILNFDSMQYYS